MKHQIENVNPTQTIDTVTEMNCHRMADVNAIVVDLTQNEIKKTHTSKIRDDVCHSEWFNNFRRVL